LVSCIPQNEMVVFAGDMNVHIVIAVLAMMGHMVVLGIALGTRFQDIRVCIWAKLSHLQHIVYEAGSQVGNICSWPSEKYS